MHLQQWMGAITLRDWHSPPSRADIVNDREPPSTPAIDSDRSRTVVGPDGRYWTVYEFASSRYDRRTGISLIFVTDDAMRRVRDYPADWFELSAEDLYDVSFRR